MEFPLICLGRNTGTTTQSTTTALDNLPTDLKGSNSVVSAEPIVRKYSEFKNNVRMIRVTA